MKFAGNMEASRKCSPGWASRHIGSCTNHGSYRNALTALFAITTDLSTSVAQPFNVVLCLHTVSSCFNGHPMKGDLGENN